ncbi:MAG: hypothetical protein E4H21_08550, partial [Thermodesulfobacteriales bacterium]
MNSEKVCETVFKQYLENLEPNIIMPWQDHPNGPYSPPDFSLIFKEKLYAVEATALEVMKKNSKDEVNVVTYTKSRIDLVNELQKQAVESGILRGKYNVHFMMDWLIRLTPIVKNHIRTQAFSYIQKTMTDDNFHSSRIRYKSTSICEISKRANSPNRISISFSDAVWPGTPEIRQNICDMLQHAISIKKIKLTKESVPPPWILLIYNSDPFASQEAFNNCIIEKKIKEIEFFDCIFIVMPFVPLNGFVL